MILLLAVLAGCTEAGGTAIEGGQKDDAGKARLCETAGAVATGFGKATVTEFAHRNLDLKLDEARDRLVTKGARGFSVDRRKTRCEAYIDFGGPGGQEHKCRATARLCGQLL